MDKCRLNSNPAIVEAERICLRPHLYSDFDDVAALWTETSVLKYIALGPLSRSEAWTRLLRYVGHWAMLRYGYWVVENKLTGEFLGEVGFADWKREITPSLEGLPELGWIIKPSAQGQGFATEAIQAALLWGARNIEAKQTVVLIDPDHEVSIKLARKVGFGEPEIADFRNSTVLLFRRALS